MQVGKFTICVDEDDDTDDKEVSATDGIWVTIAVMMSYDPWYIHHHVTSHCICKYAWVSIPKECLANAGFAFAESAFSLHTIRMHWKC